LEIYSKNTDQAIFDKRKGETNRYSIKKSRE